LIVSKKNKIKNNIKKIITKKKIMYKSIKNIYVFFGLFLFNCEQVHSQDQELEKFDIPVVVHYPKSLCGEYESCSINFRNLDEGILKANNKFEKSNINVYVDDIRIENFSTYAKGNEDIYSMIREFKSLSKESFKFHLFWTSSIKRNKEGNKLKIGGEPVLDLPENYKNLGGFAYSIDLNGDNKKCLKITAIIENSIPDLLPHEFGHLLGLGHEKSANNIMNPTIHERSNQYFLKSQNEKMIKTFHWMEKNC